MRRLFCVLHPKMGASSPLLSSNRAPTTNWTRASPPRERNLSLLPQQTLPRPVGLGYQEIGSRGRAEKAQPCPPLCNKKGGAVLGRRPRAHCAPRCAVTGGGDWAWRRTWEPPPHRRETYNKDRREGRAPYFSKSPTSNQRQPACCPSFALTLLTPQNDNPF